jgi:hypothetical protein
VSPLELVDDRFEKLASELRAARPVAPEPLRARVRALEPPPRRGFELNISWSRVVPAVAIAVVAAAVGAAGVVGIVHGSTSQRRAAVEPRIHAAKGTGRELRAPQPTYRFDAAKLAAPAPATDRLQRYDAWLRVRVRNQDELSKRTSDAMRLTRRLGGYIAWASYSTPTKSGDSELQLQIPIERVQAAIAAFSGYGTLVGQRIRLKDEQRRVDALAARIRRLRAEIARLQRSGGDPGRLQRDRARLAQLTRTRTATVKRAQMASVALTLIVAHEAAAAPPSRFHRTIDDAGSVLARELEILLYTLVVAGPLLAIGGAGILASRSVRRRSDERLLERS